VSAPKPEDVRVVRCKGCGGVLLLATDGRVGHEKSEALVGIPNSVKCDLFRRCSALQLAALHDDSPTLEPMIEISEVKP
jgi:hypothetical protein